MNDNIRIAADIREDGRSAIFAATMAWLCVSLTLGLMATRFVFAISLNEPLLTVTSGAEEESSFALWKYVHNQPVYSDPTRIPFAASYYNWLFYSVYGEIERLTLGVFRLNEAWLPTIGRFISLIFAITGAVLAHKTFVGAGAGARIDRFKLSWAWALFVFFGPLIGFWAMSINPELPGMVLVVAGTLVFLRLRHRRPMAATLLCVAFSCAAWSFKQSHLTLAGALGLFLLLRRDWLPLALAISIHVAVFGVTLALGSAEYRHLVLLQNTDVTFTAAQLVRNFLNFTVKFGPGIGGSVIVAYLCLVSAGKRWHHIYSDDRLLFSICGVVAATFLSIPPSAKIGAAENYYFILSYFVVLMIVAMLNYRPFLAAHPRWAFPVLGSGWSANAIATAMVLLGITGVISVRDRHLVHVQQRTCIENLEGPLYSSDPYLALPWITNSTPNFVTAYNYAADRSAGRNFERGGIGGLIAEGYFGTLVIAPEQATVDGASLDRYEVRDAKCGGLTVLTRKP